MNTIIYQMQKEKWIGNINLKSYLLKYIIVITSIKILTGINVIDWYKKRID